MTDIINSSRRKFLIGTGVTTFVMLSTGAIAVFREDAATHNKPSIKELDAWISISSDNQIIIRFASTEMGQGVMTSLPMIVAEELDANWSKVTPEQINQGPLDTYGNKEFGRLLFTAGSASIQGYFTKLRFSGAKVRRILIYSVAKNWGVPVDELTTEPSEVVHALSGRRATFGAIASTMELVVDVPEVTETDLKPQKQWRIIGHDQDRLDIPAKTRGETVYSIDVRIPDMVYATQVLAPVEGETPTAMDASKARKVKGVIDIVTLENSVAVVANTLESAIAARDLLAVTWSQSSPYRTADSEQELQDLRSAADDLSTPSLPWENRGKAVEILERNKSNIVSATYVTEHVYHAQMEPLCAIASVDDDEKGAEVWLGTQSQTMSIAAAAQALQTKPERIRFHGMQMGGGFGRRTFFGRDLLKDAIHISRTVKKPVKLIWTREDDVKNAWLRPATAHHMSAIISDNGDVEAFRHRVASPSIFQFVLPQRWNKDEPDALVMEGTESSDYDIANFRAETIRLERQSRVSAWRGIGWGVNSYARECFIDELASKAGQSPADLRRRLLRKSPRGLGVLEEVIKISNFGDAPEGRAHGLSFAGYKNTFGAGVAEVSVDPKTKQIKVHKFWAAVDPGIVVHPENYIAQTEGGILFGLSGLMHERISFKKGEIQQNNFYDYELMRMNSVPELEVSLVESGEAPSGGGEIGVPMTGGAVANAVRALTGISLRQMPFDFQ